MYSNYMKPFANSTQTTSFGATNGNSPFGNKGEFFNKTNTTGFAPAASTSTFGQPAANTSMFSSMQPTNNIFQSPSTSGFNAGAANQSGFGYSGPSTSVGPSMSNRPRPGSALFGQQQQQQQQPQQPTTGLFGSTSNAFGQAKPAFGFNAPPNQTPLFGQQAPQPSGSSLFQSNSSTLFGGSNAFGGQTQTGTVTKFAPVTGNDTMQKNGVAQSINTKHYCITCMKEYENKSLEELRFEDYSVNRKGPQQQAGFSSTPFGAPAANTSMQGFGQNATGFGQTSTFGQNMLGMGIQNQTTTPSLFGKPAGFGTVPASNATTFGFNSAVSNANPFSANQAPKPFTSQPLFVGSTTQQPQTGGFGMPAFAQTTNQNTSGSLFPKPAQPATGFNTGQSGFTFNQTPSTQASSLFPASKPNTGFGIFGQTSTTATGFGQTAQQPAFGNTFGKTTLTPSFGQPAQTGFNTGLSGNIQQSQSLFGNQAAKPPSLFGNTNTGGNLFQTNTFQPTSTNFSLQPQQPQAQFPPEHADASVGISLVATESFPEGPHVTGLEPVPFDVHHSATNPTELRNLLDSSKKKDDNVHVRNKMKVTGPKPKRGINIGKEFFDSNCALKTSRKCLVIRKVNEAPSTIYNKYRNELIEEAEASLRAERVAANDGSEENDEFVDASMNLPSNRPVVPALNFEDTYFPIPPAMKFGQVSGFAQGDGSLLEGTPELTSDRSTTTLASSNNDPEIVPDNPAGVVLTKPEYYMFPPLQDLHQHMNESGECVVQGLTIGRRGYGNVYFTEPINITKMNLDEIVHFRHREIIVYPDEATKAAVGEGLNRPAQVTLDKIFPREKGTSNYITDVSEIIKSNFVDNLMVVTQKHNCKFVDYRPKTGSWVFKVKHFSKYAFTDSDEEDCEISKDELLLLLAQKKKDALLQPPLAPVPSASRSLQSVSEGEDSPTCSGLGGVIEPVESLETILPARTSDISTIEDEKPFDYWQQENLSNTTSNMSLHGKTFVQNAKSVLFMNIEESSSIEEILPPRVLESVSSEMIIPSKIISCPRIQSLPLGSHFVAKASLSRRCYMDMALFRGDSFKVGWKAGCRFITLEQILQDYSKSFGVLECSSSTTDPKITKMMPSLVDVLKITREVSDVKLSPSGVPTFQIQQNQEFLRRQSDLFFTHITSKSLTENDQYLYAVFSLCQVLWGSGSKCPFYRRTLLSKWLKQFSYDLSEEKIMPPRRKANNDQIADYVFQLLSFHKVEQAADFCMKNNLPRLGLIISQLSANNIVKDVNSLFLDSYTWKGGAVTDPFKKIYMLLSGVLVNETISICEGLDWKRAFGLHFWYISHNGAPIEHAMNIYREAFEKNDYVMKPQPPYSDDFDVDVTEFDLLYHILRLYVDGTHQLCYALHPATHTKNLMDYRLSWILLQLFQSLQVGLVSSAEETNLHTTFSNQLEEMGLWKWAVFVLLFLKDDLLKKNLIVKILERNLSSTTASLETEHELVNSFKVPAKWVHEVKAVMARSAKVPYESFQHLLYMDDYQEANKTLVAHLLPELFINEQYPYLEQFIEKIQPKSGALLNWKYQAGLFRDFFAIQDMAVESKEDEFRVGNLLNSIIRRIAAFPLANDAQKLCVAELSKKCALIFKTLYQNSMESESFRSRFIDVLDKLVMPPDYKHFEFFFLIANFAKEAII